MFPIRIRNLVRASMVALTATAALGGCNTSTSDRDLRPVTAQEGISLAAGTSAGAFTTATSGIWVDPRRAETFAEGHDGRGWVRKNQGVASAKASRAKNSSRSRAASR